MIELTESAAKKIKELLVDKTETGVRTAIAGGGCSGFQYKLEFSTPTEEDKVIISKGVEIYVDKKSYLFLAGTTIDFVTDLLSMGFKFINPNAQRTCGCGESFGV